MAYWLVKQEPETYPFSRFMEDKSTIWDGIRNYQARNFLKEMALKDEVLYYHSGGEKAVAGLAEVAEIAFPEPGEAEGTWFAVKLKAIRPFKKPVTLAMVRADSILCETYLVRQTRLSVSPLTREQFDRFLELEKQ
jgi:predicted RNA-binding protein with PUA-like domain